MAGDKVKQQAEKIIESAGKLQNMTTDESIHNEIAKIKEYCQMIENQI